ncbi:MAG: hypothetical protein KAS39_00995 [Actinomycetia bacterium]|nr:hypothetical protein [Actinomycetes bacterium]
MNSDQYIEINCSNCHRKYHITVDNNRINEYENKIFILHCKDCKEKIEFDFDKMKSSLKKSKKNQVSIEIQPGAEKKIRKKEKISKNKKVIISENKNIFNEVGEGEYHVRI